MKDREEHCAVFEGLQEGSVLPRTVLVVLVLTSEAKIKMSLRTRE